MVAASVGLDPAWVLDAPAAARRAEGQSTSLDEFLAPAGRAVGRVLAHTARIAGVERNAGHSIPAPDYTPPPTGTQPPTGTRPPAGPWPPPAGPLALEVSPRPSLSAG